MWTYLLIGLAMISLVLAVSDASAKKAARDAARSAYFQTRYDASVDRMLNQCPLDRDELRALRDSGRSGPAKAVRLVLRSEPVPLAAAAEFVKRV